MFSADEAPPLPIPRPRLPAPRTNRPSFRPRPSSAGRPNPRPATLGSRPLRQQSNRATTRQETGSGETSFSNKSKSIASSAGRSKTTSSRTKGMKQAPEFSIMTWLFRCQGYGFVPIGWLQEHCRWPKSQTTPKNICVANIENL